MSYWDPRPTDTVREEEVSEKVYRALMNFFRQLPKGYVYAGITLVFIIGTTMGAGAARPYLTSGVQPAGCTDVTVQSGDSLSTIAKLADLTLEELLEANPQVTDPDRVYAGDYLCYPKVLSTFADPYGVIDNIYTSGDNYDNGQAQPGTKVLASLLQLKYPNVGKAIDPIYGLGTYASRNSRGGSSYSTHATGRAVDIYVDTCSGEVVLAHYEMMQDVVSNAKELGVQRVVLCQAEWRQDIGWRAASEGLADMHGMSPEDYPPHAHIELSMSGAEFLTKRIASEALGF